MRAVKNTCYELRDEATCARILKPPRHSKAATLFKWYEITTRLQLQQNTQVLSQSNTSVGNKSLCLPTMLTLRDFENLQIESLRPPGKTTAKAAGSGLQNERQFANDRKESTNVQQRAYITLVSHRAIRKTNKG